MIIYRNMKKNNMLRLSKAEGSLIYDQNGKRYIDFTSAWNVTNLGWNHPEVKEAIIHQAEKNAQGLLWGIDPIQEAYAEKLTACLPRELDACTRATGGTEAVEEAIKIARAATGRKKIIGFKNSYHGQLFASLALGFPQSMVEKITPLVPEFIQLDFPSAKQGEQNFKTFLINLEEILQEKKVAGIVTEPGIITSGWGLTAIAYPGFLKALRDLTAKYGTLLIIDEVGTGFGRTGKLFCIEYENIVPDMLVLAKGISNGAAAIGTVVGKSEIFETAYPHITLLSTFGWIPIGCAAALKTLEVHLREKTWELAEQKGDFIRQKLWASAGEHITEIRGLGLEIGVSLKSNEIAGKITNLTYKQGLHVAMDSENSLQLMPPLTISHELLEEGLEILIRAINTN